ncbi:MAG: response regulator [Dongiaceae bacterium]
MADVSQEIVRNLPYLRRYARALTGSQSTGDSFVRISLETLLQEPERVSDVTDVRRQLFELFHQAWRRLAQDETNESEAHSPLEAASEAPASRTLSVENRLQALPSSERQILLLTALEGFSIYDAAQILEIDDEEAQRLLSHAWKAVNDQIATSVLVIEDEPVIALDIVGLVREMGHSVVGVASSRSEAVAMARARKPGLVLADIHLGEGGSGLVAVKEILDLIDVPVIFVTAYPERLLTGERPEPTYLVTKPFESDTLKVTISQALSTRSSLRVRERSA